MTTTPQTKKKPSTKTVATFRSKLELASTALAALAIKRMPSFLGAKMALTHAVPIVEAALLQEKREESKK